MTSDPARRPIKTDVQDELLSALALDIEGPKDAPLVVVLHGWGASAAHMRGFVARLADRYRVVNVDLPGHGKAPMPSRGLDMEAHAELVGDLIRTHGGQAHVIGHSNGGRIGLFMASRPPFQRLIRSLTIVSPSGIPRPRGPQY